MDPKFRSSFIPKRPVATPGRGGGGRSYHSFNLIGFLGTLLFIVTLLGAGGVFAYRLTLQRQIDQAGVNLAAVKDTLDLKQIASDEQLAARISMAKELVQKHVTISRIFNLLDSNTLHQVGWNELVFKTDPETGMVSIIISGEADDFNSLSLQEDLLERDPIFENPHMESIKLTPAGTLEFDFTADINQSLIGYVIPDNTAGDNTSDAGSIVPAPPVPSVGDTLDTGFDTATDTPIDTNMSTDTGGITQ